MDDDIGKQAAEMLRQLAEDIESGRIRVLTAGYGGRLTEWGFTEQFFEMTWDQLEKAAE